MLPVTFVNFVVLLYVQTRFYEIPSQNTS